MSINDQGIEKANVEAIPGTKGFISSRIDIREHDLSHLIADSEHHPFKIKQDLYYPLKLALKICHEHWFWIAKTGKAKDEWPDIDQYEKYLGPHLCACCKYVDNKDIIKNKSISHERDCSLCPLKRAWGYYIFDKTCTSQIKGFNINPYSIYIILRNKNYKRLSRIPAYYIAWAAKHELKKIDKEKCPYKLEPNKSCLFGN